MHVPTRPDTAAQTAALLVNMRMPFRDGSIRVTLSGCGDTGLAGISQLADVPGRWTPDHGGVEIRIILDRAEPPTGRLRVVGDPGQAYHPGTEQGISFTGWLGLLKALYEVTAEPGDAPHPRP
jgi:hypothetical protein